MSRLEGVELLWTAAQMGASDLHLSAGTPPHVRINGHLSPIELPPLTDKDTERIIRSLTTEEQWRSFIRDGEIVFCYALPNGNRFRCSAYRRQGGYAAAIRVIPAKIRGLKELGLPDIVGDLVRRHEGLILVTGSASGGKTTTLAAMVDLLNSERSCLIITLEEPVEYVHTPKKGVVNQREVGTDTVSFAEGVQSAVQQNADVIAVGRLKGADAVSAVLRAAETGKLVLACYDTTDAVGALEEVVDLFPVRRHPLMLRRLASVLQGIISQQLFLRADGKGLVPALEILVVTPAVRNLIREGKLQQIVATMETGTRYGMQTMEASVKGLEDAGIILRNRVPLS